MLLRWLGIDFQVVRIPLYTPSRAEILAWSPSGKLPVLIHDDLVVWDSLAVMVHLAEKFPVWPPDPQQRAFVQSVCAEVHTGFGALRSALPFNARARARRAALSSEALEDIARIEQLWIKGAGGRRTGSSWITSQFGPADIAFAPIACRFRTYGIILSKAAEDYAQRLLEHPLVEEWVREAEKESEVIQKEEIGVV